MDQNKLVIVTGTSRGLGRSIAMQLLGEGYRVLGISRSPSNIASERFTEFTADLEQFEAIPDIVRRAVDQLGRPFALVNNSAIGADGLLATQGNREIASALGVNLLAPILLTKYVAREMLVHGEGRIVNIGSIVSETGYSGLSVYAATKAGLRGFTKSLSRELGRRGITVNAIQPGFMQTDMTSGLDDEALYKIASRSALRRVVETEDVSRMVSYLLGPGGTNITGSILTVDAGSTA